MLFYKTKIKSRLLEKREKKKVHGKTTEQNKHVK